MGQRSVGTAGKPEDSAALTAWREQETAFLADFVPIAGVAGRPDRSERFPPGWWILPTLAASAVVWAAIFALFL